MMASDHTTDHRKAALDKLARIQQEELGGYERTMSAEQATEDLTADEVRRISVTNSVWLAIGQSVDRDIVKRAVEEGERIWREQHLPTLGKRTMSQPETTGPQTEEELFADYDRDRILPMTETTQTSPGFASAASEALVAEHLENCRLKRRIGHLELVMRECCDAIRDSDEFGALRMLEVALKEHAP